jgi:hypothetical protein
MSAVSPSRPWRLSAVALSILAEGCTSPATTAAFAHKTALGIGQSKFDNFTLLLFVSFTLDDLEARESS